MLGLRLALLQSPEPVDALGLTAGGIKGAGQLALGKGATLCHPGGHHAVLAIVVGGRGGDGGRSPCEDGGGAMSQGTVSF